MLHLSSTNSRKVYSIVNWKTPNVLPPILKKWVADDLGIQYNEDFVYFNKPGPISKARSIYGHPNRKWVMMSMIAITSSVWIQFPVFGKLGLNLPPKAPSSQSITRTTTIIHNNDMRFLLSR